MILFWYVGLNRYMLILWSFCKYKSTSEFCKNKEFKYVLKETLLLSLRKYHEKTTSHNLIEFSVKLKVWTLQNLCFVKSKTSQFIAKTNKNFDVLFVMNDPVYEWSLLLVIWIWSINKPQIAVIQNHVM